MALPGISRSPFHEGFAALREEPLLLPAELLWRSCFALSAWMLVLAAGALILDGLQVSTFTRFLLSALEPAGEGTALAHLFQGTLLRAVWIKFIALAVLIMLWSLAAAAGRSASLRRLLSLVGGDDRDEHFGWQFWPMVQLNLVRGLWTWTAITCLTASFLLATALQHQRHPGRAAFFYVFGAALSMVFGMVLNWFFGLAPLFCMRNQADAGDTVSLTLDFCARQGGPLFSLSLAFLALRLLWAGCMFFVVLAPIGLGKHVAIGWVLLMMGVLFLIYLAGADALNLARLGAYAALAEIDARPAPRSEAVPPQPPIPFAQ